jgi:hypothetical protein
MSLTLTILMIIGAWLAVAAAMLWGVLRIARRHPHYRPPQPSEPARDTRGPAPVN